MRDTMTDLETLGTVPGCAILSIGAAAYDDEKVGETFYTPIYLDSCRDAFLTICPKTQDWWNKQGEDAQKVLTDVLSLETSVTLRMGLEKFNAWITRHCGMQCRVWGNGSDFDNAILAAAYDAVKLRPAWKFTNNRCYRTVKALAPAIKLERVGTYHNAVDDAVSQANHHIAINQHLGIMLS